MKHVLLACLLAGLATPALAQPAPPPRDVGGYLFEIYSRDVSEECTHVWTVGENGATHRDGVWVGNGGDAAPDGYRCLEGAIVVRTVNYGWWRYSGGTAGTWTQIPDVTGGLPLPLVPLAQATVAASAVTCNLPPSTDPGLPWFELDPTTPSATISWDDVDHPGMRCATSDVVQPMLRASTQLAPGRYLWSMRAIGRVSLPAILGAQILQKPGTETCRNPAPGRTIIAVTIDSTFPMTVQRGSRVKFEFRVSNTYPVVHLRVELNGKEVRRVEGTDVTAMSGMWFNAPEPGTYNLTVYARDLAGCDYRSGLVRQLIVK